MPKLPFPALCALLGISLLAPQALAAQSRNIDQTTPLEPGGLLRLEAAKGSVRLTSWDRPDVQVRARIEADAKAPAEYRQRSVDATSVDITSAGNVVSIRSNYDLLPLDSNEWHPSPSIHYEILAPRRVDLDLELDRSNTTLAGFEGRIVADTDRSELDLRDLSGELRLEIDRGGNSRIERIAGSVAIESDRTNLSVGLTRLQSTSSLQINRGDADVILTPGTGLTLETTVTRRAEFLTSLPMTVREWTSGRGPSGEINGGGPRFAIQADRARVTLR